MSAATDLMQSSIASFRLTDPKELDATLLLIASIGFLPATDPRVRATVESVERNLLVDGLVQRYRTAGSEDGLPPGEGAFLACSFWLVDAYCLIGRVQEAEELFDRLLALRNDVGLLAEEYDPRQKRMLGNFPQAFSISRLSILRTISAVRKSPPSSGGAKPLLPPHRSDPVGSPWCNAARLFGRAPFAAV